MPVKIFFCYAHEDEALVIRLKSHLKPLERQGLIEIWYDREIGAGAEWEKEISHHLNAAQIILLLVRPDFMNSEYCYGTELKRALERHKRGEVQVIPVIGRAVYWQGMLGQLQALPKDALPITDPDWHNQDRALYNTTEGIRKVADLMIRAQKEPVGKTQQSVFPTSNLASSSAGTPSLNAPLSLFMAPQQSSPQLSGSATPSSTPSSFLEAQRETEMFEKDFIFDKYISERMREKTIPSTWHIYQPLGIKVTKDATDRSFLAFSSAFLVCEMLTYMAVPIFQGVGAYLLLLPGLLIALLSAGLGYRIYRHYELQKKLVLTPNGCVLFQNERPLYIFRYSKVKRIQFFSSDKILVAKTKNLGSLRMSLKNFDTPESIAYSIDSAHTLFITNHHNSTIR
jgi:hypothetical protein